jgi:hypothetical protein
MSEETDYKKLIDDTLKHINTQLRKLEFDLINGCNGNESILRRQRQIYLEIEGKLLLGTIKLLPD